MTVGAFPDFGWPPHHPKNGDAGVTAFPPTLAEECHAVALNKDEPQSVAIPWSTLRAKCKAFDP